MDQRIKTSLAWLMNHIYFLGYEYWAEDSSDARRAIYEEIKAEADSSFGLDWGMTLEKSW